LATLFLRDDERCWTQSMPSGWPREGGALAEGFSQVCTSDVISLPEAGLAIALVAAGAAVIRTAVDERRPFGHGR
jgi:hypothetical protein